MFIIDEVFRPLYGKPCWQVQQGHGSFLTFEFGEPALHIRELFQVASQASEKVRERAMHRLVYVHGAWHLWIYLCNWRILAHGQKLAYHNASRRTIKKATQVLDGQQLTGVMVNAAGVTFFDFDLGGRLEVFPNPKVYGTSDNLWLLYEPSGGVFALRGDGQYSRHSGNTSSDEHLWQPLLPVAI